MIPEFTCRGQGTLQQGEKEGADGVGKDWNESNEKQMRALADALWSQVLAWQVMERKGPAPGEPVGHFRDNGWAGSSMGEPWWLHLQTFPPKELSAGLEISAEYTLFCTSVMGSQVGVF